MPASGDDLGSLMAGEDDLSLNDHLAVDRTALANERTLLAYVRTALQLTVAGVSLIKFFDDPVTFAIGVALVPIGFTILGSGFVLFLRRRRRLQDEEHSRAHSSVT